MSTLAAAIERRAIPRAALVYAAGLVVALVTVFVLFGHQSVIGSNFDPYLFGAMGRSLANGHGFSAGRFGNLLSRRGPLYPAIIGVIYWVFGERPRLILTLHCLLFAGVCVLVYDIGRRVFNERTGLLAAAGCMLHPMLLRYLPTLHLETVLTFVFTVMIWTMVRFHERPTVRRGIAIGAAAGVASLAKTVAFPVPFFFAAGFVLAAWTARRRGEERAVPWKGIAAIVLALVVTLTPWTIRNYRASGHLVLVTTGTSDAFLRGLIFSRTEFALLRQPPYTVAENESNAYFRSLTAAKGVDWEKDDYATDQILNAEAKRRLLDEPGTVARHALVGLATFWYQLTSLKNSLLALVLAAGAWALALVGWRRSHRERRGAWVLYLPILSLNVLLARLLALGRYSVPILPALTVLAAFGADTLLGRRSVPA